jgi:hypothetical protein
MKRMAIGSGRAPGLRPDGRRGRIKIKIKTTMMTVASGYGAFMRLFRFLTFRPPSNLFGAWFL